MTVSVCSVINTNFPYESESNEALRLLQEIEDPSLFNEEKEKDGVKYSWKDYQKIIHKKKNLQSFNY